MNAWSRPTYKSHGTLSEKSPTLKLHPARYPRFTRWSPDHSTGHQRQQHTLVTGPQHWPSETTAHTGHRTTALAIRDNSTHWTPDHSTRWSPDHSTGQPVDQRQQHTLDNGPQHWTASRSETTAHTGHRTTALDSQ